MPSKTVDTFHNIMFSNMPALAESDVNGIIGILTNLIKDDQPNGYYKDQINHFFAHKMTDEDMDRRNLVSEFPNYKLPYHFLQVLMSICLFHSMFADHTA